MRTCSRTGVRRPGPGRTRRLAGAVLGAVMVTGCAGTPERAGAPLPSARTGPTVLATPTIPPLAPRPVDSDEPSPPAQKQLQKLSNAIDVALTAPDRLTPATRISQKAAAGNQVIIRWTVGLELPDRRTRTRVRTDAIKILLLVRASAVDYGSVLLLATGAALHLGKKTVSIVVRAKYTAPLVRRTDWARVRPTAILRMPDDKPAVIAAGYR